MAKQIRRYKASTSRVPEKRNSPYPWKRRQNDRKGHDHAGHNRYKDPLPRYFLGTDQGFLINQAIQDDGDRD